LGDLSAAAVAFGAAGDEVVDFVASASGDGDEVVDGFGWALAVLAGVAVAFEDAKPVAFVGRVVVCASGHA
jgi:hypothetical protein